MKREPQPRDDGRCFVCGKKIPRIAHVDSDAFCSTVCCRVYFETTGIVSTSTKS